MAASLHERQRKEQQDNYKSYMNVVPQEYDYMAGGSTPRTIYHAAQAPAIKVDVTDSQTRKINTARAPPRVRQQPTNEERYVYQPLDLPSPDQPTKAKQSLLTDQSTAISSSDRTKEEVKNPFWDSLDQGMWVEDSKVRSCTYC